jgi:hypothetical protein
MPRSWYQSTARRRKAMQSAGLSLGNSFGVGEPGVVVDREVEVLPAGAAVASEAVAVNALADRPEAPELFDVDVHELTRTGTLVAGNRAADRLPQARDAVAAEHLPHRRGGQTELAGDDHRTRLRVLTGGQDALLELRRQSFRLVPSARSDDRDGPPTRPPDSDARAGSRSRGSFRRRPRPPAGSVPSAINDTSRQRDSNENRIHLGCTLDQAFGPPWRAWSRSTTRLAGGPDAISRLAGV